MLRTLLMRPTLRMPQAVTEKNQSRISIAVDFDASIQTLDVLQAAAYRLIGTATCRIEKIDGRLICNLEARSRSSRGSTEEADELRTRFLDLVTDENLRTRLAEKTAGIRNVMLALAFGSLAADQANK
jgi:His-Xaa-Ser system protein HxsD